MEQNIIIKMILGFVVATLVAVGGLWMFTYGSAEHLLPTGTISHTNNYTADPIVINEPIASQSATVLGTRVEASTSPTTNTTAHTPTPTQNFDSSKLYSLINAYRKEHQIPLLLIHHSLEISAQRKLQDMIATKYWHHENPQGIIDWSVFEQSGYHYEKAGENLSFAHNTPWEVFSGWVESPTHNQQLLSPDYEHMGIAVDCTTYETAGEKKCVVVLHLGKQLF